MVEDVLERRKVAVLLAAALLLRLLLTQLVLFAAAAVSSAAEEEPSMGCHFLLPRTDTAYRVSHLLVDLGWVDFD